MKGAVCVLAALAVMACSSPLDRSASASPAASSKPTASPVIKPGKLHSPVAMPTGFPNDVPIYPGARLTAAAGFPSTATTAWGMEWETLDSVGKVQGFYAQKLSQGDWTWKAGASSQTTFSGTFARKSNPGVGGTLAVDYNGGVTKIDLSLVTSG